MNISELTCISPISKTLRFSLLPIGNTEKNIEANKIINSDKKRSDDYLIVKPVVDRYHKTYIEKILSSFVFSDDELSNLSACYNAEDKEKFNAAKKDMLKKISIALQSTEEYKNYIKGTKSLFIKDKKTGKCFLSDYTVNEEEKRALDSFASFSLYFNNYSQNRINMYTGDGKTTEIANRIISQNFPKFIDNLKVWKKISDTLPSETIEILDNDMEGLIDLRSDKLFCINTFNKLMSQRGIDNFNQYIGGYTCSDGTKIKGLNEYINLFSQNTGIKLPKMKPLFKQILSDRESFSFIPEAFKDDCEVLCSIKEYYEKEKETVTEINNILCNFSSYNTCGIFVKSDASITNLSNIVYGAWNTINKGVDAVYERNNPKKSTWSTEKYEDEKSKAMKKISSYSLYYIDEAVTEMFIENEKPILTDKISEHCSLLYNNILGSYNELAHLLDKPYPTDKKLTKDTAAIGIIKNFLDALKEFQRFSAIFAGNGDEPNKDDDFYGIFEPLCAEFDSINRLYDKVRNYITKKPYSIDKIKLNFDRSDFLGGWAQPGEWGKQEAHLFEKDGKYYIFVTSRTLKENDWKKPLDSSEKFEPIIALEYNFQKPDNKNTPRLFIRSKGDSFAPAVSKYNLPINDIIDIYDKGFFKTEYRKKDEKIYKDSLEKIIDYFKLGFTRHDDYKKFTFKWKPSCEYDNIADFYSDTINSCYYIEKKTVNYTGLLKMVENGDGYLFEIYSKDFSTFSHGKPNLHTMYFKALFDTENSGHIRLSGGGEMFFRKKSLNLSDTAVHPKKLPIKNKNPLNTKSESVFEYDLIKDKRFTKNHYELHLPIELNYTADDNMFNLNKLVTENIYNSNDNYVIGIDRGERNLLYYSVIDSNGKIVEQASLNIIENETDKGVKIKTDYNSLLDSKEKGRMDERLKWGTIESIKEIKEGYLSQAIHKICMLVEKYNAIIVLENLNKGFKNTRSAVEKSVYQKFEKMLTDKLNYLVNKDKSAIEAGGYMNGYQLAMAKTSYNEMQGQNGILFYIPAWLTSKIDPTTGFVDMLYPKYETVEKSKIYFELFDDIRYNKTNDQFEFDIDYSKFPRADYDYINKWTVCSNGERIYTHRSEKNNGQFISENIVLTEAFKKLFDDYGIDYTTDMKKAINRQTEKAFFVRLTHLLKLTLQMRNSITGTETDYLISPVKNKDGVFFDSRVSNNSLPQDADANGAYNIARKGLWIIEQIKNSNTDNLTKVNKSITQTEWLKYAQTHC